MPRAAPTISFWLDRGGTRRAFRAERVKVFFTATPKYAEFSFRAGKLTTLYSFCSLANCADGSSPGSSLIQATDGNFYGTTAAGGTGLDNNGTIFEITPAGGLTTLYDFYSSATCLVCLAFKRSTRSFSVFAARGIAVIVALLVYSACSSTIGELTCLTPRPNSVTISSCADARAGGQGSTGRVSPSSNRPLGSRSSKRGFIAYTLGSLATVMQHRYVLTRTLFHTRFAFNADAKTLTSLPE
jgi:uncharacterized repeat protein (TIGR03803 family)